MIKENTMDTTWYGYNWKNAKAAQTATAEKPMGAEVVTAPAPDPRPTGPTPPTAPAPDPRTQAITYKFQPSPRMNAQDSAVYYLGLWVQSLVIGYDKPLHKTMTKKFLNALIDEKLAELNA